MEALRISLSSIDIEDLTYQVRDSRTALWGAKIQQKEASKNHINQMVNDLLHSKAKFPNIKVVNEPLGSSRYVIFDGFHRCNAYKIVNEKSKGKRFKQLTVDVMDAATVKEKLLDTNTEHNALTLQPAHRTELNWQKFLKFEIDGPAMSKKELAETLGVSTSTIGGWRRKLQQFKDAGLFKKKSHIDKNMRL